MLDKCHHGHVFGEMERAVASLHSTALYNSEQKQSYQS